MVVQVCEASKSLLHTRNGNYSWKSFIVIILSFGCHIRSQKLKHQTLVLAVRTFNVEMVQQLHNMM